MKRFSFSSVVCSLWLLSSPAFVSSERVITGKIESCSALHHVPAVESFLKHGEAAGYENVEVEYIGPGRFAILKINKTDSETGEMIGYPEEITLNDYRSVDALHKLFEQKGFQKKHHEEVSRIREEHIEQVQQEKQHKADFRTFDKYMRKIDRAREKIEETKEAIEDKIEAGEEYGYLEERLAKTLEEIPELEEELAHLDGPAKKKLQIKYDQKQLHRLKHHVEHLEELIQKAEEDGESEKVRTRLAAKLVKVTEDYDTLKAKLENMEHDGIKDEL